MKLTKNNLPKIEKLLQQKKVKMIAMLAPSFVAEFDYPQIIHQLKQLGFDKVVELTFGAKMVNREYHKLLEENSRLQEKKKKLWIASVCPGIVCFIREKYPQFEKNIIPVDSPMIAMAKICKRIYSKHTTVFISPCTYKKIESEESSFVDYTIDYQQLKKLFSKYNLKGNKKEIKFDKFYNDYTKIYPLAGGLSKTAHLEGIIKPGEERKIDGILEVEKFLKNPDKKVVFLDVTFCKGGCIGGPCMSSKDIMKNRERVMGYMKIAAVESIPEEKKGLIKKADGINFKW
jgi:iron only hydrogenase large subunit-like protein